MGEDALNQGSRRLGGTGRSLGLGSSEAAPGLSNDHWVSKGYQNNFATAAKRIAIVDVSTHEIVDHGRPTKTNFAEVGFTTYLDNGERNEALELAFAAMEKTVLNQIRLVSASNRNPTLKAAVADLCAIHLVRSPAFKAFHETIVDGMLASGDVAALAADPELHARFEQSFGRPPEAGELTALTQSRFDAMQEHPASGTADANPTQVRPAPSELSQARLPPCVPHPSARTVRSQSPRGHRRGRVAGDCRRAAAAEHGVRRA